MIQERLVSIAIPRPDSAASVIQWTAIALKFNWPVRRQVLCSSIACSVSRPHVEPRFLTLLMARGSTIAGSLILLWMRRTYVSTRMSKPFIGLRCTYLCTYRRRALHVGQRVRPTTYLFSFLLNLNSVTNLLTFLGENIIPIRDLIVNVFL